MQNIYLSLALALAANELIHNVFEVAGMRRKLTRLAAYIDKRPFKEMRLNINTRTKSYALALVVFLVFVIPLYILFLWLDLDTDTGLRLIIFFLVVSYSVTAVTVDQFHVEIEKITKKFKK